METWRPSRSSLWAADGGQLGAGGRAPGTHGVLSLPIDNREQGQLEPKTQSCLVYTWGPVGDRLGTFQGPRWTCPPDFRPAGPMFRLHSRPHCPAQDTWMDTLPKSLPEDAAQEHCPGGRALDPRFSAILALSPVRASALPRPKTPSSPDKRVDDGGGDGRSSANRSDQVLAQRVRPC